MLLVKKMLSYWHGDQDNVSLLVFKVKPHPWESVKVVRLERELAEENEELILPNSCCNATSVRLKYFLLGFSFLLIVFFLKFEYL